MTSSPNGPTIRPFRTAPPSEIVPAAWTLPGAPALEIDVGCHKGLFLTEMAIRYPERNFLGIECQSDRVGKTRKKIDALGLANAWVVRAEGLEALRMVPDACGEGIHVLFPDPWPKRRHHTRRLVQREFLTTCLRILKPGGLLRLVTDDTNYSLAMREAAQDVPQFREEDREDREYPLTEFQKKFLTDGRPFFSLLLRRRAD